MRVSFEASRMCVSVNGHNRLSSKATVLSQEVALMATDRAACERRRGSLDVIGKTNSARLLSGVIENSSRMNHERLIDGRLYYTTAPL